jgi:hypothetical protein
MSPKKKKAQQHKDRLSKKTKHQAKTLEESEKRKHNNKIISKRCREAESPNKAATRVKTNRENMKRCREAESPDKAATHVKTIRENMKRCHEAESPEAAVTRKTNNNASKKRKRQGQQQNFSTTSHNEEMTNAIKHSMKEVKKILHRTQHPTNPHSHRAIVCIICDRFIIGTEKIHKLTSNQISQHSNRLSVETYEKNNNQALKVEVRKQYQVNDDKLKDLLIST